MQHYSLELGLLSVVCAKHVSKSTYIVNVVAMHVKRRAAFRARSLDSQLGISTRKTAHIALIMAIIVEFPLTLT